jgi:hypothetical protein
MADRRTFERLLVAPESLERIEPDRRLQLATQNVGPVLVTSDSPAAAPEDRTEPMRLSFLALLAERDPLVQARLNRRLATPLELPEADGDDEDRPTDPMIVARFNG